MSKGTGRGTANPGELDHLAPLPDSAACQLGLTTINRSNHAYPMTRTHQMIGFDSMVGRESAPARNRR